MSDPYGDNTGWRAEAFRDFTRYAGVGLHLWRRVDGAAYYVESQPPVITRLDDDAASTYRPPSLSFDDGQAVAVLAALSAWHGGTSEVRTLRRDYDAERARVDKLTEAIIAQMARRPS